MKERIRALRYLVSTLAISAAFSLVCLAQQAAGQQTAPPPPQQVKEYPATRAEGMALEWARARDYTKEYLDAMPADGYSFKPTPDIRSFSEQMMHLAAANFSFGARLTGQTNPYQLPQGESLEKKFKTKEEVTKVVMESYDFMITGVKGLTDAKLNERSPAQGLNRPRAAVLDAAFEHQTHHRGQTTIYLRLKGVTPPAEKLFSK